MKMAFVVSWWVMGSALAQEASPPVNAEPPGERLPRLELGVQAGYLWARDSEGWDHGGVGLRVQGLAALTPYYTLGPEVSLHPHGGSRTFIRRDTGQDVPDTVDSPLLQLGGVMQFGGNLGPMRPYFLISVHWFKGVFSGLGYAAGAGMQVRVTDRWAVVGEGRFDIRPKLSAGPSLSLGTVFRW